MTTVKKTEHQVKEAKTLNNQEYKMGPANADCLHGQGEGLYLTPKHA